MYFNIKTYTKVYVQKIESYLLVGRVTDTLKKMWPFDEKKCAGIPHKKFPLVPVELMLPDTITW